jgi:Coenzyme PQQ synthesis protein D (PqqD)
VSEQRFRVGTDVTSKVVDGEAIIINLSDGTYYSLQSSGAVVWAMAAAGHAGTEITDELARRFATEGSDVAGDVERLLGELTGEELLVADEAATAGPFSADLEEGGAYSAPGLEKYTDMADLMALDPPMPGIREVPWESAGDQR